MTTLEYCVKYDLVAPLNDKEHGKSEIEELKVFERVVSNRLFNNCIKLYSN